MAPSWILRRARHRVRHVVASAVDHGRCADRGAVRDPQGIPRRRVRGDALFDLNGAMEGRRREPWQSWSVPYLLSPDLLSCRGSCEQSLNGSEESDGYWTQPFQAKAKFCGCPRTKPCYIFISYQVADYLDIGRTRLGRLIS
jgi:hypothetical protein